MLRRSEMPILCTIMLLALPGAALACAIGDGRPGDCDTAGSIVETVAPSAGPAGMVMQIPFGNWPEAEPLTSPALGDMAMPAPHFFSLDPMVLPGIDGGTAAGIGLPAVTERQAQHLDSKTLARLAAALLLLEAAGQQQGTSFGR